MRAWWLAAAALLSGCPKGIDPPGPTVRVKFDATEWGDRTFTFGTMTANCPDALCSGDHLPHGVRLTKSFEIEDAEVTVLQYAACVAAGKGCPGSSTFAAAKKNQPAIVTWQEADTYCRVNGGRLPTEAEWELAARFDPADQDNLRAFPWGADKMPCEKVPSGDCPGAREPADVRSNVIDRSAKGVYDLGGNAEEWVLDRYTIAAACDGNTPVASLCEGEDSCIAKRCMRGDCQAGQCGPWTKSQFCYGYGDAQDPFHERSSTGGSSNRVFPLLLKGGSSQLKGCQAESGLRRRMDQSDYKAGFRCVYAERPKATLTARIRLIGRTGRPCGMVSVEPTPSAPGWWNDANFSIESESGRATGIVDVPDGGVPFNANEQRFDLGDCKGEVPRFSTLIITNLNHQIEKDQPTFSVKLSWPDGNGGTGTCEAKVDLTTGENADARVLTEHNCQ